MCLFFAGTAIGLVAGYLIGALRDEEDPAALRRRVAELDRHEYFHGYDSLGR